MFRSPESKKIDKTDKKNFDRANAVILNSNRRLAEDTDYYLFEVDLGTAHTNYALGLQSMGIIADSFSVHSAPAAATIRINSSSAGAITALQGLRREGRFKELYITNSASGGTLQIEVTWKDRDRIKIDELAEYDAVKKEAEAEAEAEKKKVLLKEPKEEETSPYIVGGLLLAGAGIVGMFLRGRS